MGDPLQNNSKPKTRTARSGAVVPLLYVMKNLEFHTLEYICPILKSLIKMFIALAKMFSKSTAANLLYFEKRGLK